MDELFAEDFPPSVSREPLSTFALPIAVPIRLRKSPAYDVLDISSGDGALYFGLHRMGLMRRAKATVMRSHGSEHEFGEILRAAGKQGAAKISLRFRARFYGVRLPEVEKSLRWCDRAICCTRREADYLAARLRIDRQKFSVVPHGVGEEFLGMDGTTLPKKDQIIFVGTWVWRKGTHMLGAVLSALHARHPHLRFVLAGTQVPAESVRASLPPEVLESAEIIPSLGPERLARFVAESLLMLFPSIFEGFGLAPLEAMAVGTPVVMTSTIALAEWMDGEAPALLVPSEPRQFIEACESLLADAGLRNELAHRGKLWARQFTWDRAAQQTVLAYQQALDAAHAEQASEEDSRQASKRPGFPGSEGAKWH